jgi:hypothetical protein
MTFGQVFDRTFRLMRDNLRLLLGVAAVPCIAIFLVIGAIFGFMFVELGPQIANQDAKPPAIDPYTFTIFICAVYLILPLIYALYMPAASYAATQANLGVAPTFREAYSVAWRRFWRSLWLMILSILFTLVPVVACALIIGLVILLLHLALGEGSGGTMDLALIPPGMLLFIAAQVCSILIMLRISLAYPACVVEELPAWSSLKRSMQLTKGAKGRIFLMLLVVYALGYALSLACMAISFAVGSLVAFVAILSHVAEGSTAFYVLIGLAVLGYVLVVIVTCLFTYAAFTTALAVLYYDQRLRKDGQLPAPSQAGEHA